MPSFFRETTELFTAKVKSRGSDPAGSSRVRSGRVTMTGPDPREIEDRLARSGPTRPGPTGPNPRDFGKLLTRPTSCGHKPQKSPGKVPGPNLSSPLLFLLYFLGRKPPPPPINSTLLSIYKKKSVSQAVFSGQDAAHPSCGSPNTRRRFALGAQQRLPGRGKSDGHRPGVV